MTLKAKTISGIKWSGIARAGQQSVQFVVTIILARFLMPEDFGIFAMALVFTGLINVYNDFGVGSAIIQMRNLKDEDISSIFWFSVCIGVIATLFTIFISPLVAYFYQKDILTYLLSLMAISFFFISLSTVLSSLLMKELNYRKLAIIEATAALVGGGVAVYMAFSGYGVWSLACQMLITTFVTALLLWLTSKWKPRVKFRLKSIKSIMKFSLNLLGARTVDYISTNMDYLLIGRFLGAVSLGYYTLAYRLMLYPLENISRTISKVLFPAFSTIQDDNERLCNAYLRSTRFIAFVTFPMMFGLFAVADEFILTVFGEKWEPTIFLFKVLCFVGMFQSIISTIGQIYLAKGKTDWMFKWGIFSTMITAIAILIGLYWGLKGVVLAYAVRTLLLVYPAFAIPFRLIGLKVRSFAMNFKAEFITSAVMFTVVSIAGYIQNQYFVTPLITLLSNTIIGVIAYLIASRFLNAMVFKEIQSILWNKTAA